MRCHDSYTNIPQGKRVLAANNTFPATTGVLVYRTKNYIQTADYEIEYFIEDFYFLKRGEIWSTHILSQKTWGISKYGITSLMRQKEFFA